jgi:hypothetical protein
MKPTQILCCISLALSAAPFAVSQSSTAAKLPAVITITREWVKPGKGGAVHDRSEAAFVTAMNKGKLNGHYVALNSMSGKSRALFITRYPSYEAWEADNNMVGKNASLTADLDRASEADGALLDGLDTAVLTLDESTSYHPHPDVSHAHYYEITIFHIKPGKGRVWEQAVKMYKEANDKANTTAHWATYDLAYGGDGNEVIALTARESLAEIDKGREEEKNIAAAVGEEGMKKLDESFWDAVDSVRSELFSVNPKQSYPDDAWVKSNPDFWKPKAASAKTQSAAAKPAPAAQKPASR